MKKLKRNSLGVLKPLVLASCLAVLSASAASGPTNSWNDWQYKKVICGFTNALLVSLNGHSLPAFATNLFDSETHVYLYGDVAGDVFGVGDMSVQTADRSAVFNVEANGSLRTKGSTPNLSFTLSGEGSGTVGGVPGTAELDAKFVQTKFLTFTPGGASPEVYYAEGKISGTVKQPGAKSLKFEETIQVLLDNVPGHYGDIGATPQLRIDIVDIDGNKFAGHTHGTNDCFGKYEGDPSDELLGSGSYKSATGGLVLNLRGLGLAADAINCTVTGQLGSAAPGSLIHINNVKLTGKAYGQKPVWLGNGLAYPSDP